MTGPSVDERTWVEPPPGPRWPASRIARYVAVVVVLLLVAAACRATAAQVARSVACCGKTPTGEVWFCRQPDSLHARGEQYLLAVRPVGQAINATYVGEIGTPLRFAAFASETRFELHLSHGSRPPNDAVLDETTTETVVLDQLIAVEMLGASDGGTTGCPPAPAAGPLPSPSR